MRNVYSNLPFPVAVVMLLGIPLSVLCALIVVVVIATHPSPERARDDSPAPIGYHPPVPENEKSDAWDRTLKLLHDQNAYFVGRTYSGDYGVYYWDFRLRDGVTYRYTVDERRGTYSRDFR